MRGIETQVRKIRRQIFAEVSRIGFESDDESLIHDIEAIPYKIVTEDGPQYRDSIYRARAIATERVRLAMGMCLRPTNKPVHLTDGIEASNISEKYYEPPLMQVVPSACASCEDNKYEVSDMCKGCLAHPCAEVCPKHAISMVNGHSYIDQAIGLVYGRSQGKDPKVNKAMELSAKLYQIFCERHKVSCCKVLTRGMEKGSPEHMQQCIAFTGEMAYEAAKIIAENAE